MLSRDYILVTPCFLCNILTSARIHTLFCPRIHSLFCLPSQSLTVSEIPRPFSYSDEKSVDEDYFFRPWKIHKKVVDGIKSGAQNDPEFVDIALNNREFLRELFIAAGAKEDYIKNPFKCLWSTTHLYALMECEGYWHKPNERTALLSRIPMEMRRRIEELACLVWSRRFVHPCVDSVLGAPLSVEIFQVSVRERIEMRMRMRGIASSCVFLCCN